MDSFVIKLSGKAELPESIEIGHNFRVELEGSIVSETIADNEDGTKTHYFTFKPIIVETITEKGKRMRAKDTRSRSVQMRSLLFKRWREQNIPQEFEEYYDVRMVEIMKDI